MQDTALLSPTLHTIRATTAGHIQGFFGNRGSRKEPLILYTQIGLHHGREAALWHHYQGLLARIWNQTWDLWHIPPVAEWFPHPQFLPRRHVLEEATPYRPLDYLGTCLG